GDSIGGDDRPIQRGLAEVRQPSPASPCETGRSVRGDAVAHQGTSADRRDPVDLDPSGTRERRVLGGDRNVRDDVVVVDGALAEQERALVEDAAGDCERLATDVDRSDTVAADGPARDRPLASDT